MSRRTRITRRVERAVLGAVMVVVARAVERRLVRAVEHRAGQAA